VKPLVLSFSTSRYGEPTTFGEFIRKARLEKGLRQEDVAQAIGVDEATITNWESYPTVPVRGFAVVRRLCGYLGLPMGELVARFRAHDGWRSPLVAARIARGLTQEQVARAVGIDPTTLSRWERNSSVPPSWMRAEFLRLGEFLGLGER